MLLRGYKLTWVFLWPAWSLWFMWCLNVNGDVVLTNNGYKGVTVALSPRLSAENLPPEFLRDLLELLNSASQAVFKETDDRAFFEEVTLVVPESLDAENFLNGTTIKTSSNPSFKSAHVLIESDNGAVFGRSPYTLQYGPCGTPGLRIVLPVSNVLGQNGSAMAQLKKGSKPVRYATVTARVTVPDGTEVKVELVDNGAGDPDITAGDGIYSRYFTLFSDKGRYSLSVVAQGSEKTVIVGAEQQADDLDSRCCGSEFPTTGSRPSGSFTRNVQYGSFFVISQKPPGDIYPPSRIVDLKVLNVEADTMRVTLRWTAPGNDFDQGKAKGYDIRYFDRAVNFAEDFDTEGTKIDPFNIDGLSGSPKLSGEIEEASVFNFKCSRGPSSCFFAIRAYDEVRSGPVSNVVEVTFPELTSTDDTDPSFNPHTDGNGSLVQEDNDRNYARGGLTTWQLGLAVAVPLLIFIVLIILLVMCCFFRRRGNDDSKESSPPPPTRPRPIISAPMRTKESTPKPVIKDENKNHYAVSVLSGSTISPVNSYSADYLMDKYEEETKQKQNGVKAPTAPSRSDVGSSDGDTSMDTAVGEQNWWTPRARNSQEMGLPLNPTYLDRARPANNLGAASSGNVPAVPRRKHTFV
ncbi:calcium activated chlorine channel, putative [Ixodes scapularis]|uniref:Calcium activated chlorine channel, putative n=1 Tax=Ixodes scapularis TaxID=6945 RepID=B7PM15_IXOSC|nr:calcium activated chlorine channel, putative [Ixodes scapularis]|eukprot:XP_002434813.1 calcium activated chlorine channel, putative [Ixodes scapularis]